jgi:hypothetical protein
MSAASEKNPSATLAEELGSRGQAGLINLEARHLLARLIKYLDTTRGDPLTTPITEGRRQAIMAMCGAQGAVRKHTIIITWQVVREHSSRSSSPSQLR